MRSSRHAYPARAAGFAAVIGPVLPCVVTDDAARVPLSRPPPFLCVPTELILPRVPRFEDENHESSPGTPTMEAESHTSPRCTSDQSSSSVCRMGRGTKEPREWRGIGYLNSRGLRGRSSGLP